MYFTTTIIIITIITEVGPCQQGVMANSPVEHSTSFIHSEEYEFHEHYDFTKQALHFWTPELDTHRWSVEIQERL